LTGFGGLLLLHPVSVQAETPRRLALDVASTCPSRAQLSTELSPLLDGYVLGEEPADAIARLEDQGNSYEVRVGDKARRVRDPARHCVERARVAAVFLALSLPRPQPAPRPRPSRLAPAAESPDAGPRSPLPTVSTRRALALRVFGEAVMSAPTSASAVGVGLGIVGQRGPLSLSLLGEFQTPSHPDPVAGQPPRFELRRVPFAALLGWETTSGLLGWGAEGGLALDFLEFRGESVPNPQAAYRLNAGLRASAALRVRASRRLTAELFPGFSFFPRTYLLRVEPASLLAETPMWWLGVNLGLSYSVWSE
jgi:hypothetical protein